MNSFKILPLSDLRSDLPRFKRQVQLGYKRIAASYYGQIVGFLVPLCDVEPLVQDGWIIRIEEMSLTDFRSQMTECWERLQVDTDCIYLKYHSRRAAAFVSPRFAAQLPIPVSEVAHKLLSISSGVIEMDELSLGEKLSDV